MIKALVLFTAWTILFAGSISQANFGAQKCSKNEYKKFDGFAWDERRGEPSEFDPGPVGSEQESWLKLFGQTPNYRKVSEKLFGDEKFRWMMGPMWYRGRLGKNEVKVFIVGQEGAQDENVTNRAFTGSTGSVVQKFLNDLGIYESYIYLNTYVYTINGQRITSKADPKYYNYVAMEQGLDGSESPIVEYRHQLFDNVIAMNPESIALFIAVGGGAKDSLATWIDSRSGNNECSKKYLTQCDLSGVVEYFTKKGILKGDEKLAALGLAHPGMRSKETEDLAFYKNSNGESVKVIYKGRHISKNYKRLLDSFKFAAIHVRKQIKKFGDSWLPVDPQEKDFQACYGDDDRMKRLNLSGGRFYDYVRAPIPFKDFSFSTNWRMGNFSGTTSNRNGAARILVFGEKAKYDDSKQREAEKNMEFRERGRISNAYTPPESFDSQFVYDDGDVVAVVGMKEGELAYEHPRYSEFGSSEGDLDHAKQFDPGPSSIEKSKAFMDWPNFKEIDQNGYINDESFGFGAVYRGNSRNPGIIIVADQISHTDFFSTRALTGEGGQYLQPWLNSTEANYLIVRSLPVDTLGIETKNVIQLALAKDGSGKSAVATLKGILSNYKDVKIIAMGPVASAMLGDAKIDFSSMSMPKSDFSHVANWVSVAKDLGLEIDDDKALKRPAVIPRGDLPYSSRWWMGTSGNLADRGEPKFDSEKEKYEGSFYRLEAPKWVRYLDPKSLNPSELESVEFLNSLISEK